MTDTSQAKTPDTLNWHQAVVDHAQIGWVMPDGTVYAGISVTTGTKMFTMPQDSDVTSWSRAIRSTQRLKNEFGYNGSQQTTAKDLTNPENDDGGWRLPTLDEMKQIITHKNDIGNLDNDEAPGYWCSSSYDKDDDYAKVQHNWPAALDSENHKRQADNSVRLVRSEPRMTPVT